MKVLVQRAMYNMVNSKADILTLGKTRSFSNLIIMLVDVGKNKWTLSQCSGVLLSTKKSSRLLEARRNEVGC